jgi:hypothetical protein
MEITMRFWKIVLVSVLAVGVTGIFNIDTAEARRGGGFRSSSSSFSSSSRSTRSTPSRSSNWGGSNRSTKPSTPLWGGSNRSTKPSTSSGLSTSSSRTSTKKPVRSAADQALYNKAKTSGTAYTSKASATQAFKTKHASQYTSKYDTKPATRPDHIPQTTTAGGKTYNVTYNQQYGGYGYMGPSGSWIMYDAMADAVMMSTLMNRHNYYYDRPGAVTYVDTGGGARWLMWFGLIVVGIIIVGAFLAAKDNF